MTIDQIGFNSDTNYWIKYHSSDKVTHNQALGAEIQKLGSKFSASIVGLAKSHLLRTITVISASGVSLAYLAGLATGITIGVGSGVYLAPWVLIVAVSIATLGLLYLTLGSKTKLQKHYLELSVLIRKYKLWNDTAWNELYQHPNGAKLYISQMFNRLGDEVERFLQERQNQDGTPVNRPLVIISIQEPWERLPQGLSIPYTDGQLAALGVTLIKVDSEDFLPVGGNELTRCQEEIKKALDVGADVVIHCKAGKGRSAMGAAAYLREHGMPRHRFDSVDKVANHIMDLRPESSIYKIGKKDALRGYFNEPFEIYQH